MPELLVVYDRGYRNFDRFGYNAACITLVVSTLGAGAHRLVLLRPLFF